MLEGHGKLVHPAAFLPDCQRIILGSFSKIVRMWHAVTGDSPAIPKRHNAVGEIYRILVGLPMRRLGFPWPGHTGMEHRRRREYRYSQMPRTFILICYILT